jgi:hypothetical protein
MKPLFILFTLLALTFTNLAAQETEKDAPYIEVTGMAEKEIIPDEIYIRIIIKERYDGRDKITIEA